MEQNIVAKISAKTFGKITIETIASMKDKEKRALLRVVGVATSYKTGVTDIGAFVKFTGRFVATCALTGEIVHSGTAILPKIAQDLLHGQLDGVGDGVGLEFAFDIGFQRDDTSAVKYVYTVKPLIDMAQDDPIIMLMARVNEKTPMLAAPKETPSTKKG